MRNLSETLRRMAYARRNTPHVVAITSQDEAVLTKEAEYLEEAAKLLEAQEPVEPHYTRLEYKVNGMPYVVHHPECPRCIENGLMLWDAEIEKGAAYCKRCGQAVKWE